MPEPRPKRRKEIVLHKGKQYDCYVTRGLALRYGGTYYLGRDCPRRHKAPRYAKNCTCVECVYQQVKKWRKENPEGPTEATQRWRERHPAQARKLNRETKRRWRAKHA
jgi:hypothetical protein